MATTVSSTTYQHRGFNCIRCSINTSFSVNNIISSQCLRRNILNQPYQPSASGRRHSILLLAAKGFGNNLPKSKNDRKKKPSNRTTQKRIPQNDNQQLTSLSNGENIQARQGNTPRQQSSQVDAGFEARLSAVKAQGEEKRKALSVTSSAPAPAVGNSAKPLGILAKPLAFKEELVTELNAEVSDPLLKRMQFGPNQLGLAVSAAAFGLIFMLVAGGELVPSTRFMGVMAAHEAPDAFEEGIIRTRISQLEEQLRSAPSDLEATQALAMSYAQLHNYHKAAAILDKVARRESDNADAWRLLGETRLLAEQSRQAVYAFEKAAALRGDDLQIATGMVDAYIANGQHAKAVAYLQHLRTLAPPVSSLGVVAVDAHTSTTDTAAHPATGSTAAQGDSSSGTGALAQEDAAGMGGAAATEGSPGSPAGTTSTGAGAGTSTTSSHQDAEPAGAFMDEGSSAYTYAHPVYEAPALQAGSWAEEAGAADQAPAAAAAALAVGDTVEGAATSVDASDAGGASLASASVGGQPASTSMSQGAPEGGGSGAEGSHEAVGAQEEVGAQGGVRRSSPLKPLDPVSIELLLAKVYAVWRGHAADAVATYDAVMARFPTDYRPYLAKAVHMRDAGKRAEAERLFEQARSLAPDSRQQFVQQASAAAPAVEAAANE